MSGIDESSGRAVPVDYDQDLDRFLTNQKVTSAFARGGDLHEIVAQRLQQFHPAGVVLDVGGGNGILARDLSARGISCVATAPGPAVRADARQLPLADRRFDAVAALWMLYHLPQPVQVLWEAARVLKTGGLFVTCAPSRHNDPEFKDVLPGWGSCSTFDAEGAADLIARVLEVTETTSWDAPLVQLPDRAAITQFLRGRPPMSVTKRGTLVWARVR